MKSNIVSTEWQVKNKLLRVNKTIKSNFILLGLYYYRLDIQNFNAQLTLNIAYTNVALRS